MIRLEMMRVFKVVAQARSLQKAAEVLHRTPSALSMTLSQLQEEVGAPLFETDRKNRLTPFGARVLEEATRAVSTFDRSAATIQRYATATAGLVRIAAVPSTTIGLLPAVITQFHQKLPDVRLEISDVNTEDIFRRIRSDEADIGIVSTAAGSTLQTGEVIGRHALGIVHHADGPIAKALQAGALPSWDLLALETVIDNSLFQLTSSTTVEHFRLISTIEVRNTTALLAFVENRMGVTILPENTVQVRQGPLRFTVPTDPASWRELRKIRNPDRRLSPAGAVLWDLIH
ncbi:MAG TPA: LysR family transcriptional regulator [Castellaniella sp.]|uniref:LysR family transcriptional regulator n=1 Tax=Castellaniella sp. TaxID=1955812 RepID=UPI002F1711E8